MKRILCIVLLALLLSGCAGKADTPAGVIIPGNAAPTGSPSVEPAEMLTPLEAQAVALETAGLEEEEVLGLHAVIEIEGGIPQYAVEFRVGHVEYEYHIHAETGAILSAERDN